MNDATPDGARQAALALHAMDRDDRAWVLDALPGAQRAALQALLDDLASLRIPPDANLLRPLLEPPPAGSAPPRLPAGAAAVEALLQREPPRLLQAWRGAEEAPALQAAVRDCVARALATRAQPRADAQGGMARWRAAVRKLLASRRSA